MEVSLFLGYIEQLSTGLEACNLFRDKSDGGTYDLSVLLQIFWGRLLLPLAL